tara:strand:- start:3023 stop:4384 length:1362 start_codon:yes stop_codon:yes gene_type:complete
MNNENIKKLRKEIDQLDDQLLDLFIRRSLVVEKIGTFKDTKKTVIDKERENRILEKLISSHKGNYPKDSIIRLWREIFYSSAKLQSKKNDDLFPKRGIDEINLYKGGISKIGGKENIIKLSSNESPFGPSLKAIEAYEKTSSKLSRYPELTAESLQLEIAKKFDLNSEQIICGTGSDEVLIFSVLSFCSPGDEIIHAKHGFEMYPIIAKYAGAESVLASEIDFKINTQSILDNLSSATKLIFIANPNNPTSTYLNTIELKSLLKKIPKNIVVVIDKAYAEFADAADYDNSFNLADEFENVLITRTFSKAYSLAGLRLGWGYGSKKIINILKKLRPPFNITPGAIAAGIASLNDPEHLEKVVNHNNSVKKWFADEINKIGFKAYPTQTNFTFVVIPRTEKQNASMVHEYLLSKGIAVRDLSSYGLKDSIRITLGLKEELDKTIMALKEFVKKNA